MPLALNGEMNPPAGNSPGTIKGKSKQQNLIRNLILQYFADESVDLKYLWHLLLRNILPFSCFLQLQHLIFILLYILIAHCKAEEPSCNKGKT